MLNIYKAFAAGQRFEMKNESEMEICSIKFKEKNFHFLILNTAHLGDAVCSGQAARDEK